MHLLQSVNVVDLWSDLKELILFILFVLLNGFVRWLQTKGWKGGIKTGVDSIETKVKGIEETLAVVKYEFEINGGGTVKGAVLAMRDNLEQLRDIQTAHATIQMNACDFPVFKCDKFGNWTFANEVLVEMFGVSYHGLMRRKWLELIPNVEDRLRVVHTFQACADGDIPFRETVQIQNQDDERLFLVDIRANAFRGRANGTNEAPVLFYFGRLEVIREIKPE